MMLLLRILTDICDYVTNIRFYACKRLEASLNTANLCLLIRDVDVEMKYNMAYDSLLVRYQV